MLVEVRCHRGSLSTATIAKHLSAAEGDAEVPGPSSYHDGEGMCGGVWLDVDSPKSYPEEPHPGETLKHQQTSIGKNVTGTHDQSVTDR